MWAARVWEKPAFDCEKHEPSSTPKWCILLLARVQNIKQRQALAGHAAAVLQEKMAKQQGRPQ